MTVVLLKNILHQPVRIYHVFIDLIGDTKGQTKTAYQDVIHQILSLAIFA